MSGLCLQRAPSPSGTVFDAPVLLVARASRRKTGEATRGVRIVQVTLLWSCCVFLVRHRCIGVREVGSMVRWGRRQRDRTSDTPEWNDLPDEDLVRFAKEDREAFGVLYERYAPEITGFIRTRTGGNDAVADDIASMVFTKALTALPRYDKGPFRAWLYQITRNTIIDEYRRKRPSGSIDNLGEIEADGDDPLDHAVASDAARRLHEAILTLKPAQREIVRLRLHGLSIAEVAKQVGLSENGVKSAQRRAFIALKKHPGVQL